ncbi:MAG: hypothetical protein IJD40_10995 [Lachnospiraceae bacterium]|nr:hypothetical protein [Lachnospiraceae bacterium]
MANVNGLGSDWARLSTMNNYSYLFDNSSSSKSSTSGNLLGIDLAEYSSITRGSYSKLIKAYYAKYGDDAKPSSSAEDKSDTIAKTTLKNNANELYEATNALVSNGKESVFKQVELKKEDSGETTKGYDKDKIYDAVNSLIKAYNGLVDKSTDSNNNAVLRQTLHMINSTASNSSLLADVGISIGADNKLAVDEEAFKNADMNKVKTLFNGSSSLGGKIQSAASNIYMNVNNSLGDSNFYTAGGTLGNYSTGNILDNFL